MRSQMARHLAEARLAVHEVKRATPLKTYNKMRDTTSQPEMLPFRILMRGAQVLRENLEVAKLPPDASYERKIEILAEAGRRGMSGNCAEMAAIAFVVLRDRGVRPLEFMQFLDMNHAFVILGRPAETQVSNFASWAPASVVCDPWYGAADVATQLQEWHRQTRCELLHRME